MMESKEAEEYKAPIFPEYLKYRDIIYSPKDSNDVFSDILMNCSEMFATIIKQKKSHDKFKIKASFLPTYLHGPDTVIVFRFFTAPFDSLELTAVQMEKRSGDLFEYHKIYKFFLKTMELSLSYASVPNEHMHKKQKTTESPLKDEIELLP